MDSRFFIVGSRKVYQEELDEIRENNYPKQMVDLFEKEGGYPEEWLHQSVFAQVVEGMDVIDRIIRENPSTPEEEITDIEIVSVNIGKISGKRSGTIGRRNGASDLSGQSGSKTGFELSVIRKLNREQEKFSA